MKKANTVVCVLYPECVCMGVSLYYIMLYDKGGELTELSASGEWAFVTDRIVVCLLSTAREIWNGNSRR